MPRPRLEPEVRHEIFNLPNVLTAFRILLIPLVLVLMAWSADGEPHASRYAMFAALVYSAAAITDFFDGWLARNFGMLSIIGKFMDPVADKVLVCVALVMLIAGSKIPAWVVFFILARELVITGLRGVAASAGIVVAASGMGKLKSVLQYTALCILIFPPVVLPIPYLHELGLIVLYVSAVMTVWSGVDYFYRFQKLFLQAGK